MAMVKDPETGRAKKDFDEDAPIVADNPLPAPGRQEKAPARKSSKEREELRVSISSEVRRLRGPNSQTLTRSHVQQWRLAGFTKNEVVKAAELLVGVDGADKLAKDLDSYGTWAS